MNWSLKPDAEGKLRLIHNGKPYGQSGTMVDALFADNIHIEFWNRIQELEKLAAEDWKPTAENINNLPRAIREYVHDLETRCDPARNVSELTLIRDQNSMLLKEVERLKSTLYKTADGVLALDGE